ncbi:unnamed protein product, partial [marine sediment metagenome]
PNLSIFIGCSDSNIDVLEEDERNQHNGFKER